MALSWSLFRVRRNHVHCISGRRLWYLIDVVCVVWGSGLSVHLCFMYMYVYMNICSRESVACLFVYVCVLCLLVGMHLPS